MAQIDEDQLHHVTGLDDPDAQPEFNTLHSSIAPISSLPEEVLAMVFKAGTQKQGPDFAVLVSHVTRSWRNIALATPRLWTTIRCEKTGKIEPTSYPETSKRRTDAFLARSRSSPLIIYIRHWFTDQLVPNCTSDDLLFFELLSHNLECCQHLSIADVDLGTLYAVLMTFSHRSAPLLESLELGAMETRGVDLQLPEPLFPSGAPHLRTVQFTLLDFTTFHFCLPALQSVTSLRLAALDIVYDDQAYASLREGLMALPSLTHLELQESQVDINPAWLPVVLPALQVLHASSFMYGWLQFLGPCIHVASLTVLALQGDAPFERLPEVYFPSLQHLILLDVSRTVPGFDILNLFPSIQRLTCQAATWCDQGFQVGTTDVLAALGPGPDIGHRIPCPQLHTIAVSENSWPLDLVVLTTQLSTLREIGIPIRTLMLPEGSLTQPGDGLEAIAELRKLVEIEDFQIDWPTPFANERFTEL